MHSGDLPVKPAPTRLTMKRYSYMIYKPNPDQDLCAEPYLYVKTVFDREDAKALCTLQNGWYASAALEEKQIEHDELGRYERWEALLSGTLETEELHSDKPIENFLFSVR